MSLKSTILFSLSIVFLIIGLHQTFLHGIAASYYLFMFSTVFLLLFAVRKRKENEELQKQAPKVVTKETKKSLPGKSPKRKK